MKKSFFHIAAVAFTTSAWIVSGCHASTSNATKIAVPQIKPLPFDTIPARGGVIKITPIIHASIQIEYAGKVILVDPIGAGTYHKKADLVLITHFHPDHYDPNTIAKNSKPAAIIILPSNSQSGAASNAINALGRGQVQSLSNNGTGKIGGIVITTFPMYNIVRGPKPGQKFHPKGDGNGYILTLGGKRIYIAGDTEVTPEMRALKNIDAAFIPMNLPYTMTPQEAAVGVRAFKPKVVYPYHFRYPFNQPNDNPQQFIQAMKGSGVSVRVLDWYNAAPVARFMAANKP